MDSFKNAVINCGKRYLMKYFVVIERDFSLEALDEREAVRNFADKVAEGSPAIFEHIKAIPESEYNAFREDREFEYHKRWLKRWMMEELIRHGVAVDDAPLWADEAYETYLKGDGVTDKEAVDRVLEKYEEAAS